MQGLVTIFGGSGFVGVQTVRALAKAGYRVRVAVRQLVSMQRALVAELVTQAQRLGQVAPSVDPPAAAVLFVAMLQGLFLQQALDDLAPADLPDRLERAGGGARSQALRYMLVVWH